MNNYYEVLGLQKNTSDAEIKKAYRKLSLKFHPDKNPGDKYFEDWSKKINEAFGILGNPASRAAYDQQLAGQAQTLHNHFHYGNKANDANSSNAAEQAAAAAQQVSAAEKLVLRQIREMLPDYLEVRKEYRAVHLQHQQVKKRQAPPIFTRQQLIIGSIVLLLAISGLIYSSFQSAREAEKAAVLKPLPGKAIKK